MGDVRTSPQGPTDEEMEAVVAALLQLDSEGIGGKATKKEAEKPKRPKPSRSRSQN